jgi:hypothetical protein
VSDRDDVLRDLAAARDDARRLAERQQTWRNEVGELLERGQAAGLTVSEMAEALGLSKKWTSHLRERARRRLKLSAPLFFEFGGPPTSS